MLNGRYEQMDSIIEPKLQSFFNQKRVLITGHTGFKGAWLSQLLINMGANVYGYSLAPNTNPNLYSILKLKSKLSAEKISDIRDYETLSNFIQNTSVQIVFHMAAQPLVRDSYDDPLYTFETNVMGTANVLEAIRNCPSVKSVVVITTDKVYENKNLDVAFKESDRLGGHDPYSSSKACAELVVDSYRKSFLNKKINPNCALIASARAGNVIGGGDWSKDRLIPDIIRSKQQNKTLTIRNPNSVRPWQHVLDPLNGYMLLAKGLYEQKEELACAFNFAPDAQNFITVEQIVKRSGVKYEVVKDNSKHETQLLKLDATKAKELLGWRPKIAIDNCLKMTFEWYENYYARHP